MKIKYKGAFDYNYANNGDWHKNFSMLVVAKGLEAYFRFNTKPLDFVKNHNNIYDFFIRTKYGRDSKLIMRDGERTQQLQNITRYYIAKTGYEFVKIMKPLKGKTEDREFQVEAGFLCREMNNIIEEDLILMGQDLNYQYYADKIQDNIDKIEDWIDPKDISFELINDVI